MKLLELKPLWILVVASFIMAFVIVGLEGGITDMDVSVYYALLSGSTISLIAMSSTPALAITGVNIILNEWALVHTFSMSMWFFWVIAIVARFTLNV